MTLLTARVIGAYRVEVAAKDIKLFYTSQIVTFSAFLFSLTIHDSWLDIVLPPRKNRMSNFGISTVTSFAAGVTKVNRGPSSSCSRCLSWKAQPIDVHLAQVPNPNGRCFRERIAGNPLQRRIQKGFNVDTGLMTIGKPKRRATE